MYRDGRKEGKISLLSLSWVMKEVQTVKVRELKVGAGGGLYKTWQARGGLLRRKQIVVSS